MQDVETGTGRLGVAREDLAQSLEAERLRAQTGEQRANTGEQRANTGEQRANTGEQRANTGEQRATRLAERLRELGVDPDEE